MPQTHIVILNWKDTAHPAAGGAETYCENVARQLTLSGARVTLVASRAHGASRRQIVDGYTVRRLGRTFSVYPLVLLWVARHRREIDGIIDSQNGIPFFSPLAARRRTPITLLIHHVHQEQFLMYFSPLAARIGRWLESTGSRMVYGRRPVCTVSPSSRSEVRQKLRLRGTIYVLPNGHRSGRPERTTRSERPTITCVGRLTQHKRWGLLLEAVATVVDLEPELRVNLVGTGPELQRLLARVHQLGLDESVVLHGYVSNEERDRLLGEAWLTVSTSVGEGWGLSIIEAAAQGVPAVALDVPGLRDSIQPGVTGWLTSESELASAISNALSQLRDPKPAADKRRACQSWAYSLPWSATAERFRAVLSMEAARQRQKQEKRHARADAATLVSFEPQAAQRFRVAALRATDQSTFCRFCVEEVTGPRRILLTGADEWDAIEVLSRSGLNLADESVTVALCRSSDLLRWHGDGAIHSGVALQTGQRCATPLIVRTDSATER